MKVVEFKNQLESILTTKKIEFNGKLYSDKQQAFELARLVRDNGISTLKISNGDTLNVKSDITATDCTITLM